MSGARAKGLPLWLAALLALACAGCGGGPGAADLPAPVLDPAAFDGARALYEVQSFLAVGPRDAGTPGAEKAADYLASRLRRLGVEVEVDAFVDDTPAGPRTFRNVIGRIPGRRPGVILVGSHYDTKSGIGPGFQGANDSGSSTGVLLELAHVLQGAAWTGPAIELVFFDGEEARVGYGPRDGLHGSRHYAGRLIREGRARNVLGVIVLDMIGDRDLQVQIPRNSSPALAALVLKAAQAEGVRSSFSLHPFEIGDDHEPFLRAGMPAIDLIDFTYGSGPGRNDYWHTLQDTLDKISAESLELVGRVTVRALVELAQTVQ